MIGYIVRCRLPMAHLGRLDFPHARLRYRNGFIRLWCNRRNEQLVAILEDREGTAIAMQTQAEARAEAVLMGQVICVKLQEHTKYEIGEEPGDRRHVWVLVG